MKFNDIEEKIEEVKNIEELFDLWIEAHKTEDEESLKETKIEEIPKDSFVKDGYICENLKEYNGILFILKEANILKYGAKGKAQYRDEQFDFYRRYIKNEEGDNAPKQKEKMARIAHYILTGETNSNDFKKSLSKCAFLNLNKRGGDNRDKFTESYTKKYIKFINKQIDFINPEKIICLGTYDWLKTEKIITDKNEKNFIKMWHTAYQMPRRKRENKYKLNDLNVDLYLEEFINRYNNCQ